MNKKINCLLVSVITVCFITSAALAQNPAPKIVGLCLPEAGTDKGWNEQAKVGHEKTAKKYGFKIMLAFIVMGIALGVIAAVYFTIAGLLLSGLAASGNVVSTIVLGAAILSPAYIIMTALFISLLSVIFQELSGYQPPWERE